MSYSNGIDMRVCINGRPAREYSHKGMYFIESRHGTNYTVKIKNDNSYRVMVVLSVDGLDVVSGKPAEESDKGYIIEAYSSVEIKGYRISDGQSAKFVFLTKGKTYAQAALSDARNCGVIGARIFKEKSQPLPAPTVINNNHYHYPQYPNYPWVYPWHPWKDYTWVTASGIDALSGNGRTYIYNSTLGDAQANTSINCTVNNASVTTDASSAAVYTCNAGTPTKASVSGQDLLRSSGPIAKGLSVSNAFDAPISYKQFDTGTGWGDKQDDKIKKVRFELGDLLTEITMYYATKNALVDMGLDLEDEPKIAEEPPMPKAFKSKYCQPPKGWVG